jgi:hypothetical protein
MATGFAAAALYHLAALAIPAFAEIAYPPMYPPLRHVTFVIVDSLGAFLCLSPPRWLIWPYLVLTVQVLQGHGVRGWRTWVQEHQINWIDAITVLGVLLGLVLLLLDRSTRSARDPGVVGQ